MARQGLHDVRCDSDEAPVRSAQTSSVSERLSLHQSGLTRQRSNLLRAQLC